MCSPFGGIPRNWKLDKLYLTKRLADGCSPFGGIPRNWKRLWWGLVKFIQLCSPFGGIPRNWKRLYSCHFCGSQPKKVPPSGGSLEIGNTKKVPAVSRRPSVPPSGGSLEIGNLVAKLSGMCSLRQMFPLRGDP